MSKRDEFSASTKALLARRVAYLCSHPDCYQPTIGPARGEFKAVKLGEAAHITAAAEGGPRYDASLTSEQRRHFANGIWMCAKHAKQVDSDEKHFTVEMLRQWKEDAERNAFTALTAGRIQVPMINIRIELEPDILARLGFHLEENIEKLTSRLHSAAIADIEAFKRDPSWPVHPIELNLRLQGTDAPPFTVTRCAAGLLSSGELSLIASPGAGKSTTLLQLAETVLASEETVAVFIPLSEWSNQADTILASLAHRAAFRTFRESDFMLLALHGRLCLLLDGWNELDATSTRKAMAEISRLRRDFPLLAIGISTRRRAVSAPIAGPQVLVEALSEEQQLQFASALIGTRGEVLLDHAWRTGGLRELISIPLYLNALVRHAPGGSLPTTKEELLRLFISEHEQTPENAHIFRDQLQDAQREAITALAVDATAAANTAIKEDRSRRIVSQVSVRLLAEGQIAGPLHPTATIDLLVDHHVLVRSGSERNILFQHQQFQEWFASIEVEHVLLAAAAGDAAMAARLRIDILNVPSWEESILFACERISRVDPAGSQIVVFAINAAMLIDPMLAAEMVYRSAPDVWEHLRNSIVPFATYWHSNGKVDRAIRFMVKTGKKDFAPQLWPFISTSDSQVYLPTLRAADRFRCSVLGDGVKERLASLPDHIRQHVVAEIAVRSGMDGLELAAEVAKTDPNPDVQFSIIQALNFRRGDRLIRDVLKSAHPKTWTLLANAGYADEITDREISERIRREEQVLQESDTNLLRRLSFLFKLSTPQNLAAVEELIASPDFPTDGHLGRYGDSGGPFFPAIVAGLRRRLVQELRTPYDCEEILMLAPVIDDGPIVAMANNLESPRGVAETSAVSLGAKAVQRLIERVIELRIELKDQQGLPTEDQSKQYHRLHDVIANTQVIPFADAWLALAANPDVKTIVVLSRLLAGHGRDEASRFAVDEPLYSSIAAACVRHGEKLLSSPEATRDNLAELARVVRRVPADTLSDTAIRLTTEDVIRWRRVRDERAKDRGLRKDWSEASMCYTGEHTRALAAIGNPAAIEFLKSLLPDFLIGRDAAVALRQIWRKQQHVTPALPKLGGGPDLSVIKGRREQRKIGPIEPSAVGEAIFNVVEELAKPERPEREHLHALELATIALQMPFEGKSELLETLVALPESISVKRELLIALALGGEVVSADTALAGVRDLIEAAKTNPWKLQENNLWELRDWLMLLPLTDRPSSILEALDALPSHLCSPWELRRALSALAAVPSEETERVLGELARRDPRFFREYEWLDAILRIGQTSSYLLVLDLFCAAYPKDRNLDRFDLVRRFAAPISRLPELRVALIERYKNPSYAKCHWLIEQMIAECPDEDSVLALVSRYAAQQRPFDMLLHHAITEVASERRPVPGWKGAYQQHSVAVNRLRKELFAMAEGAQGKKLAVACLTAIDELRDEYGFADYELRHPNIDTGRPWPDFEQAAS
jgi:hypothetical protein